MRALLILPLLLLSNTVVRADVLAPEAARARVDHHVRHVQQLTGHFETVMAEDCQRFPSREAWDRYVDGEIDQLVLLMAHLEQAWVEAKRTPDDDVRRAAKAPRRHSDQMRQLMDKLNACAELNGVAFAPATVWRRVEREVPRRQAEIALPQ